MSFAQNDIFDELKAKADRLIRSAEDQVLATVYEDTTTTGKVITRGDLVFPGKVTLSRFPRTRDYPFHFRKTFTPESRPVQRGETPRIEFDKTILIYREFSGCVPEPLGCDDWTYRSAAVCGRSLQAFSPFSDLSYEDALAIEPEKGELVQHAQRLESVCELVEQFHAKGIVHGDLTLHNAMVYRARGDLHPVLIDLAGSIRLATLSQHKQREAINDDFSELYRDLVLTQWYIGPVNSAPARKSAQQIEELFPSEISGKLSKLRTQTWPDRDEIA